MESTGGVTTEVAIKVLRADIDPGSDSVKRLRDEGRLLGALSHPSILRVHDLVLLDHRVSLVTEYVEGEDLDGLMASGMGVRALVMVIGEVASALDAAWSAPSPITREPLNLIHRDVKPANIRIGKHGEVKLLDFGIARATNVAREAQTANDAMMGSYLYMAPERFHEEMVETSSDIFALGSILFEGCADRRYFHDMSLKQVYIFMLSSRKFMARLNDSVAELAGRDVPQPVLLLIQRMLNPDPEKRPSAAEVANICEDVAEELEGPALKRWCRKRDWPAPREIHGSLTNQTLVAGSFTTSEPAPHGAGTAVRLGTDDGGQTGEQDLLAIAPAAPSSVAPPAPASQAPAPQAPAPPAPDPAPASQAPAPPASTPVPSPVYNPPSLGIGQVPDYNEPSFSFGAADPDEESEDEGFDGEAFDRELAEMHTRKLRNRVLIFGVLVVFGLGLAAIPVIWYGLNELGGLDGLKALVESEPAIVPATAPEPGAELEPGDEPEPGAEPEPEPELSDEPEPKPDPEPAPAPMARVPRVNSANSLAAQGWKVLSDDPDAAKALFEEALAKSADHPDANYGLGYVLLKIMNERQAAKPHLCQALDSGQADVVTDVRGLLADVNMTCN
jgi:serine/threonine-protein kinase